MILLGLYQKPGVQKIMAGLYKKVSSVKVVNLRNQLFRGTYSNCLEYLKRDSEETEDLRRLFGIEGEVDASLVLKLTSEDHLFT